MISRFSLATAVFAVLATATLTYASALRTGAPLTPAAISAKEVRVIQLEHVVVIGKRQDRAAR